jgi:acyl-CoA synthetase (AMP-forming)/AMP-acid ligase II
MTGLTEDTIPALVQASAARFGDRTAIEDENTRLSYADLALASLRAAGAFMEAGVERGDRVAIWAPNVYEWIIAAIGAQSAGAVLVPLNTRLKGTEAGYILEKSGARVLVVIGEFLGTRYVEMLQDALGGVGPKRPVAQLLKLERAVVIRGPVVEGGPAAGIVTWEQFLASASKVSHDDVQARIDEVEPDDLSDIMFTSGTTGKPKGAMTRHGQNLRAYHAWSEVIGLHGDDRYLIVNPFFHAFGYKAGWLSCIMCGSTILPQPMFDVPKVLERIWKDRVSVLPGPPTLYQSILAHPDRKKHDLSCLRLAVTGAAAIPVELIQRMRRELSFETIITGYGLTEACGIATMCRFDDDPETIATTSGRAIPGVEVVCAGEEGREVARGEPGEVLVRGYNVMAGYYDDEEATAEAIDAHGWLHTGDIGVMDDRGYVRITDRKKDMFIMGGFNCYPAEIENLMLGNGDISQVAVIGVPDERMGEVGMAWVVPVTGSELTPETVIEWCRENMANYKVPRYVELVKELPLNAAGKVTKFVLRDWAKHKLVPTDDED